MKKINLENIRKAEIAVGIPSYNEADNISYAATQIDLGLKKFFKDKKSVIINVDSNSSDGTGKVFLAAKTKTPKIYISTAGRTRGKGNGLRLFFSEIKKMGVIAAASIDADIRSLNPEWVKCLLTPLFKSYDYVVPFYIRRKNDATITNHICYPLIYSLFGYDIRQPIGGDFGFSRKLVGYWLNQRWSEDIRRYGIDIFMTVNAIKGGFKIGSVGLGEKVHKPSSPKLKSMFFEVAASFFNFLRENKSLWLKENIKIRKVRLLCDNRSNSQKNKKNNSLLNNCQKFEKIATSNFKDNYDKIINLFSREIVSSLEKNFPDGRLLKIDDSLWAKIVYESIYNYDNNKKRREVLAALESLYFARAASFCRETKGKSDKEAELLVKKQARYFFKERSYLISLFS
ncbi:MAG TPA: hypothetical protein ENL27_00765 [Candidatus Parcubacteria bacterium]|nr:hypothetical protein [Candidatus Parcubacteria bacterium]